MKETEQHLSITMNRQWRVKKTDRMRKLFSDNGMNNLTAKSTEPKLSPKLSLRAPG